MFKKIKKCFIFFMAFLVFCFFIFKTNSYSEALLFKNKEIIPNEYELLSANIEIRPQTNGFGGVLRNDKIFHYAFVTSTGEVVFKEKEMYNDYSGVTYSLDFYLGDDNLLLEYKAYGKVNLVFIMKKDMYQQVFDKK